MTHLRWFFLQLSPAVAAPSFFQTDRNAFKFTKTKIKEKTSQAAVKTTQKIAPEEKKEERDTNGRLPVCPLFRPCSPPSAFHQKKTSTTDRTEHAFSGNVCRNSRRDSCTWVGKFQLCTLWRSLEKGTVLVTVMTVLFWFVCVCVFVEVGGGDEMG